MGAGRRAGEDIMNEIGFLFEDIKLVIAFLVDFSPQPFQQRRALTGVICDFLSRRPPVRHIALLADRFLHVRSIGSCPASTVGVKIQRPAFELAVEVRYGRSCGASVRRMPSIHILGMRAVAGLTALRRFRRTFCASRNVGLVICGWPACCVAGHFRKRAAIGSGVMTAPAHGIGVFPAGERLGYGADSMSRLAGVRTGADVTRLTIVRSGWSLIGCALGLGVCPAAGSTDPARVGSYVYNTATGQGLGWRVPDAPFIMETFCMGDHGIVSSYRANVTGKTEPAPVARQRCGGSLGASAVQVDVVRILRDA
jgi:hypothetical protein